MSGEGTSSGRTRSLTDEELADAVREIWAESDSEEEPDICSDEYIPHTARHEISSSEDEDDGTFFAPATVAEWTVPHQMKQPKVHDFIGASVGLKSEYRNTVTADSVPIDFFRMLWDDAVMDLLIEETNRYYCQVVGDSCEKEPPVTKDELWLFLGLVLQMGHVQKDTLQDYWSTAEQLFTPFFGNVMRRDRFLHILCFLHFSNNEEAPRNEVSSYDRLWKTRKLFDLLNNNNKKFYSPSEHVSVDEVIVLFKGRVVFRQYIPKKHKRFGIKIYKLCDTSGYTFDMQVYLGKDKEGRVAPEQSASHAVVSSLCKHIENQGHKLYMDNFFTSPALFSDLHQRGINCCGTVNPSRKGMPKNFTKKALKMKKGDLRVRVKGDLCVVGWHDKRDVFVLTNMHMCPVEGNYKDEKGKPVKPEVMKNYSTHMGYVDKSDRMANSYSIARKTWKWTKKLFFHLLDLTVLNSFLLYTSCMPNISHRDFRLALVRNAVQKHSALQRRVGRLSTEHQVTRLEVRNSDHWPVPKRSRVTCRVCAAKKDKRQLTKFACRKCNVGLCVAPCFEAYHTKVQF